MISAPTFAHWLNTRCACVTLDRERLRGELRADAGDGALIAMIEEARPHLFSDTTVFVPEADIAAMRALVAAVERIVALPGWIAATDGNAQGGRSSAVAARGAFLGYDFHLGDGGPQLIEINTNAGGGLLNAVLARANALCCTPHLSGVLPTEAEAAFLAMFREEWRLMRGAAPLQHIAIVDHEPAAQYLLPEFLLFQRLFERAGLRCSIADPRELVVSEGRLRYAGQPLDLVYNRSTDFALRGTDSAALRQAWMEDLAVITPHPQAHRRYADKRNLILLCDAAALRALGASAADIATCQALIPPTEAVQQANAEALWARRRELFFKPAQGFGSRAAYRGDKLTRRVFAEILAGDYVAQRLVSPSERVRLIEGNRQPLKLDLRAYAYEGSVQLFAARLYRGQTTNFRTPGGGFAAVMAVPALPPPFPPTA